MFTKGKKSTAKRTLNNGKIFIRKRSFVQTTEVHTPYIFRRELHNQISLKIQHLLG